MTDKIAQFIANHLPRRVVYFVLIRAWAYCTTGKWGSTVVGTLTVERALKRWEDKDDEPSGTGDITTASPCHN